MRGEQTYGWYPPAKSVWDQRKEKTAYQKECLYKHFNSTYNDKPGVASPIPPTPIRMMHPPGTPATSRAVSRAASRPGSSAGNAAAVMGLSISGSRPPSVGSARIQTSARKSAVSAKSRREAWASRLAATKISVPHYTPVSARPILSVDDAAAQLLLPTELQQSSTAAAVAGNTVEQTTLSRTQSATVRRPRTTPPPRPSRSAGSTRIGASDKESPEPKNKTAVVVPEAEPASSPAPEPPTIITPAPIQEPSQEDIVEAEPSAPVPSPPPSPPMSSVHTYRSNRPGAPLPPGGMDDDYTDDAASVDSSSQLPLDYDEQLKKYGWRFEVPGDPYNLKKPCLPVRHPYTVKLPVPKVAPNPPRGHMMNYETYFLNTIPRKPATFTIHQEWISEVLHAKRMALQKKEGLNYNFKQYAFIY